MNDVINVICILIMVASACGLAACVRGARRLRVPAPLAEPICPAYPEYMYMDFDDGTTRRCKTTPHPEYGFPTTPGFSSPEWEIVNKEEAS